MENRAIIYTRVSDPSQIDNNSLEVQEKSCIKFAQAKGYEVVKVFREEGKSAKNVHSRPVLREALAYASTKKNRINSFVVYKFDRFSRNLEEGLATISLLAKYNVEVVSAIEDVEQGPMGKALRNIMMTLGELDNELKGERVKDNMLEVFRKGLWPFKCPIGYRRQFRTKEENKGKVVILDEHLSPIIKQMFIDASKGIYNRSQLARVMNKGGFKQHYGKEATHKVVDDILRKTFYYGHMHAKKWDEFAWGKHEPLIDQITWEKAHRSVLGEKSDYQYQDDLLYPLKSHLKCSSCDRPMTTSPTQGKTKQYFYYECRNKTCKSHSRITTSEADEKFLKFIDSIKPTERAIGLFTHLVFTEWDKVISNTESVIKSIEGKIVNLKSEQESIRKAKDEGIYTIDEAKAQIDKMRQEITVLEIERSETQCEQYDAEVVSEFTNYFFLHLDRLWMKLDLPKRQALLKKIFPTGIQCTRDRQIQTLQLSPSFDLIRTLSVENEENVTL